jgi:predicted 2-oxoglutarate/Fe(II)-dependent dioxygenase YbiX
VVLATGPIYRVPAFLDRETCARIRRAMDTGTAEAAEVLSGSIERQDAARSAVSVEIDPHETDAVERRLDGLRDAVARFFGVALDAREGPGFLRYADGGFYRPHRDRADLPSWPDAARRLVAVVTFLNGPGDFEGGLLRVYDDGGVVEVRPEPGLLVAFPADLLHEVTTVCGGTRDAVVDWFYGPSVR